MNESINALCNKQQIFVQTQNHTVIAISNLKCRNLSQWRLVYASHFLPMYFLGYILVNVIVLE